MQVTPERWQQVKKVLAAALEREPKERPAYLDQVCSEPSMRREVETLIAAHEQEGTNFMENSVVQSGTLKSGTKFGPYEIVSPLGAGGMGEVYRARDPRLDREVALKVLPAGLLADEAARRRFRNEALALAKLSRPYIAVIHDVGEEAGVDYLVMECVPGQSLAERLKSGSLPQKEVISLGGQIADALEEAHELGVVHRDLKPGNIMVTPKGQVKVLDFGLAKLLGPANDTMATESLTETQGIAGTLPYMAPEQLTGEPVDARTDIYALGTVLFEMAVGRRPFQEDSAPRLTDAILHQPPMSPRALNSRLSPEFERIILKCLEKSPDDRYQSAKEVQVDLRHLITPAISSLPAKAQRWWHRRAAFGIAAALMALLAAAGWFYRFAKRGETIDSVAVLPFVNASTDPNAEYLSDGITESLINSLSQLPNLKVMSRDSAFRYKGKETDAQTVGRALGVRAVFKGRIIQRGDSLAISAELVDTRDDSHIWGQQYNRKPSDIFALQEEIAKEITDRLRVRLTGEEQKHLGKHYTASPEAYQDYLKGRYWLNKQNRAGFDKGIEYFEQALAKDPNYALAYTGLADSYSSLSGFGFAPAMEAYPKARENALRALEIDGTLAEAHTSLGYIKTQYDWDWLGAEKEFQRAIELNPNDATAHQLYGLLLARMGRAEQSIEEHKRALELDPLSVGLNRALGTAFYLARQSDQATEQLRKTLEMDPTFISAHGYLGDIYVQKSMYNEAIAEFQKMGTVGQGLVGYVYAVMGRRAEAQKALDQLNARTYVAPLMVAEIYTGLGENDKALEWLKRSYDERSIGLANLKLDPVWDPLRSDLRFADLLRRMNLQP